MQHIEEDIECVEMVGIEENLKHLSPNTWKACHPHCHRKYNCNLPSYIWHPILAPLKHLHYNIANVRMRHFSSSSTQTRIRTPFNLEWPRLCLIATCFIFHRL